MPRYKNLKPSILGLNTKAAGVDDKGNPVAPSQPRTILPGEVFEAERSEIPEIYFTQRWLEETKDAVSNPANVAPGTNVGPYSDRNPDPAPQPAQPQTPEGSTADPVGVPQPAPAHEPSDADTTSAEKPSKKKW